MPRMSTTSVQSRNWPAPRQARSGALTVEAADAKARIAIYGAKPAICALARFEEAGAVLDNPTAFDRFVQFARAAGLSGASPDDLKLVLFGVAPEPSRDLDQR